MNLDFDSHEAEIVRQLITQAIRELGPEIHHADSRQVRDQLSERRQILERILVRLDQLPVAVPVSG